jgi:predicted flap endonuclease-1-like 5' DNA nuclease
MGANLDDLPGIGAPATRALNNAGYTTLRQLAEVPRSDLANLHGMGPRALAIIQAALEEHGLTLG